MLENLYKYLTLLEFGIKFCKAFNFSLILLLLLCSIH